MRFAHWPLGGDNVHIKYRKKHFCCADVIDLSKYVKLETVVCLICGNQIPLCTHKHNSLLMLCLSQQMG